MVCVHSVYFNSISCFPIILGYLVHLFVMSITWRCVFTWSHNNMMQTHLCAQIPNEWNKDNNDKEIEIENIQSVRRNNVEEVVRLNCFASILDETKDFRVNTGAYFSWIIWMLEQFHFTIVYSICYTTQASIENNIYLKTKTSRWWWWWSLWMIVWLVFAHYAYKRQIHARTQKRHHDNHEFKRFPINHNLIK